MNATLKQDQFSPMRLLKKINFPVIFIIGLALLFRLYELGKNSLWKDEIFSMLEAQKSVWEILTSKTYFFGYMPVHHLFAYIAYQFSSSESVLRLPFVIAGVLTIVILYIFTTDLINRKVGLFASFLMSISVLHIGYSREVRYYSFLILFSTISLYSLHQIFVSKNKSKWIVIFLLTTICNFGTQATAVYVFLAEFLFASIIFVKKALLKRGKLSFAEFFRTFWSLKTLIFVAISTLVMYLLGGSFTELLSMMKFSPAMPVSTYAKNVFSNLANGDFSLFFYLPLFFYGMFILYKKNSEKLLFLLIVFFIPVILIYFFRPEAVSGFNIRYISFILTPFIIVVATGLFGLVKSKKVLIPFFLAILFVSAGNLRAYYQDERGDWRGVAKYIQQNAVAGDVIITENDYNRMLIDYYLKADDKRLILKTGSASLSYWKTPFRVFYLQHDYVAQNGKANDLVVPFENYQELVAFKPEAKISPMFLFISGNLYSWQEAEEPLETVGWQIADNYGQKSIFSLVFFSSRRRHTRF